MWEGEYDCQTAAQYWSAQDEGVRPGRQIQSKEPPPPPPRRSRRDGDRAGTGELQHPPKPNRYYPTRHHDSD